MALYSWLLFAAFLGCGLAEFNVVTTRLCREVDASACTVNEVRIDPCVNSRLCHLKKGKNAKVSFDFTPQFSTTKLKTGLFGLKNGAEIPFDALYNADACTLTSCPTEAGKTQTLDFSLHIGKKLPTGNFEFKWKLWNEDNESQMCCYRTNVRLV
ncbi:MD-2-related lipid-recognition protein-like [Bombyx mandarina]|uniref:Niemann-Pick disease type C2-like protein n=2 Tax=Bombyx TaxID=7090 RepID=A0A6G7K3Z6_BOMMO|nr:MD-2-related lipid-recognition protein-like [Bombyx mandarina]QII57783.1 Niemann-Pick disease type C2-like protein [Bombyx mori]